MAADWKTVPYKKHKANTSKKSSRNDSSKHFSLDDGKAYDSAYILSLSKSLLTTKFCRNVLTKVSEVLQAKRQVDQQFQFQEIVCYGLGRPSSTIISAYQLGMLVILHSYLCMTNEHSVQEKWEKVISDLTNHIFEPSTNIRKNIKCFLFDPAFIKQDIKIIKGIENNLKPVILSDSFYTNFEFGMLS